MAPPALLVIVLPPASISAPAPREFVALMLPELVRVTARFDANTPATAEEIEPDVVLVILPPAVKKIPSLPPLRVPELLTMPAPPMMKIEDPFVLSVDSVAPAAQYEGILDLH